MLKKFQLDKKQLFGIAKGAAIVSAIFSLIVIVLMIGNYLQARNFDMLDNQALESLIKQLQEDPENDLLREQVRTIDMLSRKALFVNLWQLRMGSYLLLGGILVLVISLKAIRDMHTKLPDPQGNLDDNEHWLVTSKTRQWTAGLGVFFLGTALIFAGFSYNELSDEAAEDLTPTPTAEEFQRNWTNFRGPGGNATANITTTAQKWNVESGEGIKWKVAVPKPGFSSPITWNNQVFLSGGDKKALEVFSFDLETGEALWQTQVSPEGDKSLAETSLHDDTGFAAPTMATNGKQVFAIFANGLLVSLDFKGAIKWTQDFGIPENHYGHSSSLIVHENILIVQYDQTEDGRLLGLDVNSGATLWRVNREIISWSSPIIVNTGSKEELIVTNSSLVESFDPKTGVRNWEVSCLDGEHGPSPAYANGLVVVANEYSSATGIKITESGAEALWENIDDLPDAASPLVTAEYVYLATSFGSFICLNAKTGEQVWTHTYSKGFYASPILVGNLIYALDMDGVMHILEDGGAYKSIGDFPLGEKAFGTPAFIDGKILVRTEKQLFCIEN